LTVTLANLANIYLSRNLACNHGKIARVPINCHTVDTSRPMCSDSLTWCHQRLCIFGLSDKCCYYYYYYY